ncbi:hypothetical protein Ptr902_00799 [Pyrenophora tritici-repentis]|uniref:Uncharacterized protein n=2 Tax=Pyrenophora tritici-repentis TaxID=45151 RepID=A0A2W1FCB2_9PLEO|nr:hypothetical protein PtrV1_02096 [Pyrenophora tritici-repentis]KAF7454832.1 hypothetical protein A1F99_020900 [Pyrenophora tritici-repentis]KAI0569664.1 hypothetical protein Alg130_11553 [Pyrenophora tritici-repentis]KAI0569682.1 hypothetical protein Alg215_11495 [Pyrenophora tritici-repentis]KAI0604277.1 hypothetical protein TUN205_11476 [Pyrenophora tritici-repentis]
MASGSALTPEIIFSWPKPNYVDPVSQKASIDAAVYATTITMICFVAARLYVRANQKSGIVADDWIMVAAAVSNTATSVCLLILTTKGLGRHLYDVKMGWLVPFAKLNLASLTLYTVSITLTKVPIQSIWDPSITDKTCLDSRQLLTANAALGVVSDFLIFLWPVAPLWQVKLPLTQRVHLVAVFSFGVLTCVGGILKAIWVQDYFKSWDATWVGSRVTIALCIEYNVGTMSGCLPCLRPLLAMVAPKLFAGSSVARSNGYPANPGGGSWRKSPFSSKNANSLKLGSTGPSDYDDTHELTDAKYQGAPRTRIVSGKRASRADIDTVPLPGIRVTQDMYIRDGNDSPRIMISDTTSEEWIMKEDSHK